MNVEEFQIEAKKELGSLIPVRKNAYENAVELQVVLYNQKYWDLLALYNNNWHYIYTIKK